MQQLTTLLSSIDCDSSTSENINILDMTTDSRKVMPGYLFIAVPGGIVDGRDFIAQAIAAGAVACLLEADAAGFLVTYSVPVIAVVNLRNKIGSLARNFYPRASNKPAMFGVTGTNGKTSCVQFLAQIQAFMGNKVGVLGTVGNGIWPDLLPSSMTTSSPLSLHKMLSDFYQQTVDSIALEVSSHALAQGRVNAVDFSVAIFTNLTRDHLDYHGDMQSYAAAKARLFNQPGLQYGIINLDDPFAVELMQQATSGCKWIGYSLQSDRQSEIELIKVLSYQQCHDSFVLSVDSPWGQAELMLPLLGVFNLSNVLAVIAALCVTGVDFQQVCSVVAKLQPVSGRMQRVQEVSTTSVIVDYAHTPDALEQALLSLREHCQGKLWCVFGCGGERDRGKRVQMAAISEAYADHVIVTSDNSRGESTQSIMDEIKTGFISASDILFEIDRSKAISRAVQSATINDIVLLAGRGHEVEQFAEGQIIVASDSELAQRASQL